MSDVIRVPSGYHIEPDGVILESHIDIDGKLVIDKLAVHGYSIVHDSPGEPVPPTEIYRDVENDESI